jgi:hypothetical protein
MAGYNGIQRDTAGYSGIQRDTAGYGGYSGIWGIQRDTGWDTVGYHKYTPEHERNESEVSDVGV